ncbi:cytochrome b561 and DOMON domain-containing protein At5g35735-like [Wolffia australiana]
MEGKLALILGLILAFSAAACTDETFSNGRTFARCLDLDALDASLHWTLSSDRESASFAYRVETDGWASWGLNPTQSRMVGTQALVALRDGPAGVRFYTANLANKSLSLVESPISVSFSNLTAEYSAGKITIYVNLVLPRMATQFNHTWQKGDRVVAGVPLAHPNEGDHLRSYGIVNLASAPGGGNGTSGGGNGTSGGGSGGATGGGGQRNGAAGWGGKGGFLGSVVGALLLLLIIA